MIGRGRAPNQTFAKNPKIELTVSFFNNTRKHLENMVARKKIPEKLSMSVAECCDKITEGLRGEHGFIMALEKLLDGLGSTNGMINITRIDHDEFMNEHVEEMTNYLTKAKLRGAPVKTGHGLAVELNMMMNENGSINYDRDKGFFERPASATQATTAQTPKNSVSSTVVSQPRREKSTRYVLFSSGGPQNVNNGSNIINFKFPNVPNGLVSMVIESLTIPQLEASNREILVNFAKFGSMMRAGQNEGGILTGIENQVVMHSPSGNMKVFSPPTSCTMRLKDGFIRANTISIGIKDSDGYDIPIRSDTLSSIVSMELDTMTSSLIVEFSQDHGFGANNMHFVVTAADDIATHYNKNLSFVRDGKNEVIYTKSYSGFMKALPMGKKIVCGYVTPRKMSIAVSNDITKLVEYFPRASNPIMSMSEWLAFVKSNPEDMSTTGAPDSSSIAIDISDPSNVIASSKIYSSGTTMLISGSSLGSIWNIDDGSRFTDNARPLLERLRFKSVADVSKLQLMIGTTEDDN